jgi:hypothetical protein
MRSSGFLGRLAGLFRWLGSPVRAAASLFPFTQQGRQTLVYLIFAGSGPALTMLTIWMMRQALARGWQSVFASIAEKVTWSLLIITCALACFVSIRAIKVGSVIDVQGRDSPPDGGPDGQP